MKKQIAIATKKDIIPAKTATIKMRRILAVVTGRTSVTPEEQVLIASIICMVGETPMTSAAKYLSADDQMALAKLCEDEEVTIK